MQPLEARPPYIRFEKRAMAKQHLATEGGGLYYVDVDFALVTPHGSKDVTEKIVSDWFPILKEQVRQQLFDGRWFEAYQAAYNAWKNDQPLPVNGTPVRNWPAASPAEVKNLVNLGVLAVEDLAVANEELLGRIGMGGRALKQRAIDWVQSQSSTAPLVAQLESLRSINAGLMHQLDDCKAENLKLAGALQNLNNTMALHAQQGTAPPQNTYVATAEERRRAANAEEERLIEQELKEIL